MQRCISIFIFFLLLAPQLTLAAQPASTPVLTSISTDVVSFSDPLNSATTFAVYGSDLTGLATGTQTMWMQGVQGIVTSGNDTGVTVYFDFQPSNFPSGEYALEVREQNVSIYTSEPMVHVVNIFSLIPQRKSLESFLSAAPKKKLSKKRVGLNVHYALGSSTEEDAVLEERLGHSHTRWMREHFSNTALMGEDQTAWFKRYDKAMQFAVDNHIRVVGMLAYGPTDGDFTAPTQEEWEAFVELTVNRYKQVVDVWEVWNEPDSPDYLSPSSVDSYVTLLNQASPIIRRNDPLAIILAGALSSPDASWAKQVFQQAPQAFDDISVHVYDCEDWLQTGNFESLDAAWSSLEDVVKKFRAQTNIWVTELGCSLGSAGVGEQEQRRSLKHITAHLLKTGSVPVVFLYTVRDRAYLESTDPYEAYFGLLNSDFSRKLAWAWYRKIKLNAT